MNALPVISILICVSYVNANDTVSAYDYTLFMALFKLTELKSGKYVENLLRTLVVIKFFEYPENQHTSVDIINELLQVNHRYYYQYILFKQFHFNAKFVKYHECVLFVDGINAIL